mgnify:CR=1 FL=1
MLNISLLIHLNLLFLSLSILCYSTSYSQNKVVFIEGEAQGTTYHITYYDKQDRNFEDEISKSAEKELERLAQMEKFEKARLVKFAKDQKVFYEKMDVKKAKKQESGLQILTLKNIGGQQTPITKTGNTAALTTPVA